MNTSETYPAVHRRWRGNRCAWRGLLLLRLLLLRLLLLRLLLLGLLKGEHLLLHGRRLLHRDRLLLLRLPLLLLLLLNTLRLLLLLGSLLRVLKLRALRGTLRLTVSGRLLLLPRFKSQRRTVIHTRKGEKKHAFVATTCGVESMATRQGIPKIWIADE